ncbi:MAG: hypothetical protein EBZ69_01655 [Alphaproteobacteria bacterium]|nr:hypothetical protein [Alphaproteobacteria bacterium]NDC95458.1 hypothetical protein [bacterium]NDG31625.1 hypothetical protein [bacterium]
MKIPSKIKIRGRVFYQVVWADCIKDNPDTMGLADANEKTIYLKLGMSESETMKTLIHEMIHAIEFEWNEPIPHRITYTLEEGIWKVLKLNKWI